MKILIVDDELGMQKTLALFLENEGHIVLTASTAQAAIKLLKTNVFDILVTDIIMPEMSGMELFEYIHKGASDCQVIIMTGEPTVHTAILAVQKGAIDYLVKPVLKHDFLKSIRNAAKIHQLILDKEKLEKENLLYQKGLEVIVEQQMGALSRSTKSIIQLLSQVVEFRDPYTAGHQRRVGNLAAEIARKMDLSEEKIETIRIIGYIHDIGKIVVPAEILCKPGPLSMVEKNLLRTHSQSGYEMLKKTDLPESLATTIYQHHERLDGSGYPRGLKGNRISLEARILMVADVVEAMQSHRPYRPSLGQRMALKEIELNKNQQFDPSIVKVCLDLFRKDGYKIDDSPHDFKLPSSNHSLSRQVFTG